MKRVSVLVLALVLAILGPAFAQEPIPAPETAPAVELKTDADKVAYSIGRQIGTNLKEIQGEINLPILLQTIKDTMEGKDALMTDKEMGDVMNNFSMKMRKKAEEEKAVQGEKNLEAGKAYLAENGAKEGVVTTASGLQYQILKDGDGPQPKLTDKVTVNYVGTLIDGAEFDSSYKRNQPTSFPVNGVIKGWQEGLQLMKVGSKYRFVVPSEIAYGKAGSGPKIGPNATLVFEVELLSVEAQPAPPDMMPPK